MYGTIARLRFKPGSEGDLPGLLREFEEPRVLGAVGTYAYRMDADPGECYLVVMFDSKESYVANAESPGQDARYRKMLEHLVAEPEWHDGEIVYEGVYAHTTGI